MTVTLADVARVVGVHSSTVSRVLSRPDLVNPSTRRLVEDAIDRLGYVPNLAARQLVSGRTSTLGMLVPDITNPFFASIVRAAQGRAQEFGLQLLLGDTAHLVEQDLSLARALAPNVDGLIVCSPVAPASRLVATAGKPLVFVNRQANRVAGVLVNQEQIVRLAVDHLRSLGHRRIGAMSGPSSYWSSGRRMREVGRSVPEVIPFPPTAPTFEGGRGLIGAVIESEVTAVVCFNDVAAMGLIAGARGHGLQVPRDLSIVGSDDVSVAAMSNPALTTVAAPLEQLGIAAVELLIDALAGAEPSVLTLDVELVERESTGPVPVGAASRSRRRR